MWALEAYKKPLKWPFRGFRGFRGLEGLEGFRPGKRQAWTPIKSHGWFEAWRTASLDAQKKPWMWAFACAGSPEEAIEVAL